MGRKTPRSRPGRRFFVETLEQRALLAVVVGGTSGASPITSLDQNGFNLTSLQMNGSATLAGSRLRLTDGGLNENASAFSTIPVDVSKDFSTTFEFQLTPSGTDPMGAGITFDIQNQGGPTNVNTGLYDSFGLTAGSHVAIKFGTDVLNPYGTNIPGLDFSDNSTGLYLGSQVPSMSDSTEIAIPKTAIDLHSGHVFQATITYNAPTTTTPGQITETVADTVTGGSWTHVYQNVDIQSQMQNNDTSGQYAYAGFTASTGSPANNGGPEYVYGKGHSTQDILNWSWNGSQLPGPTGAPVDSMNFTLTTPQTTAGAVFDANGKLVRTLWQAESLPAGTYNATWDGLDQYGHTPDPTTNPGPYTFRVVENTETHTTQVIGNTTNDPSNSVASVSVLAMSGVAVSPNGSTVWTAGLAGDTAGGGYIKQFDGSGHINTTTTADLFNFNIGLAVAADAGSLYVVAEINNWSGEFGVVKINLATNDQATGFTDYGHTNADGSTNASWGNYHYLSILKGVSGYDALRGIAVTNPTDPTQGSIFVTDYNNSLVRQYDKVTGDQVGTPFAVDHPTGIAIGPDGNLWVAHDPGTAGAATVISVYTPSGALVRDVTEVTGLKNVSSLDIVNGKLYVADQGAGQVLVDSISGDGVTNGSTPQRVGGPASPGNDNGQTTFWDLNSVTADAQGNIYTVQDLTAPIANQSGTQLEKWSPAGTPIWVSGGYEYQSVVGGFNPANPTTLYSSSLHRYTVTNAATDSWQYAGSATYAGVSTNAWSGLSSNSTTSPPGFVNVGGTEFFTLTTGNRVLFYRTQPDGSLLPAAIVGTIGLADRMAWTWSNTLGDGVPQAGQIKDSGVNEAQAQQFSVDPRGNIWFVNRNAEGAWGLYELPSQGLDAQGNPVFDWTRVVEFAPLASPVKTFVVGTDGVYVEGFDANLGPLSSQDSWGNYSTGGANALVKYDFNGAIQWRILLPDPSNNLGAVPGGGVIVGGMVGSKIDQVSADGQLFGMFSPLSSGDWLDYTGGALSVSRNPVDGQINVFTEGVGFSDNEWYQINDSTPNIVLCGTATPGVSVTLLEHPPTPHTPVLISPDDTGILGDGITSVRQPRLYGQVQAGDTVRLVDASGNVLGSATPGSDGTFLVAPSTPLADGTYTVNVEDVNAAGGVSNPSPAFTLVISATPPATPSAPSLLTSDNTGAIGDGITTNHQPHLVGSALPLSPVELVNGLGNVVGAMITSASGAYEFSLPTLPDGTYSYAVIQLDVAGVASPTGPALSLTIETAPSPAVSLVSAESVASASVNPTANDFYGNGKTAPGVFRVATAHWYVQAASGQGAGVSTSFGASNLYDVPVSANYDGTGRAEVAIFRPSTAQWFIQGPNGTRVVTFGDINQVDIPVPGDYDGVGHAELAVFRPATAQWLINGPNGVRVVSFGAPNLYDVPVPGNYDGAGRTELAVFRPSTAQWFVQQANGSTEALGPFGAPNLYDIPVPGNYDGVGRTELAVFRPSTAQWIVRGPHGDHVVATFGATGLSDVPLEGPAASLVRLGAVGGTGLSAQGIRAMATPMVPASLPMSIPAASTPAVKTTASAVAPGAKLTLAQETHLEVALRSVRFRTLLKAR